MLKVQRIQQEMKALQAIDQDELDRVCEGPAIAESIDGEFVKVFNTAQGRIEFIALALVRGK